jgi:hypothetical protein
MLFQYQIVLNLVGLIRGGCTCHGYLMFNVGRTGIASVRLRVRPMSGMRANRTQAAAIRSAAASNVSGKEYIMPFNKLHAFFSTRHSTFAAAGDQHEAVSRLPYRIVTTCRSSEVAKLEELMRPLLASYDVTRQVNEPAVQSHLTAITVEVMCSVRERAGLVQLVTHLAQEVSVRSVRWESIPQRWQRGAQAQAQAANAPPSRGAALAA